MQQQREFGRHDFDLVEMLACYTECGRTRKIVQQMLQDAQRRFYLRGAERFRYRECGCGKVVASIVHRLSPI